jgi:alcohol dehydrogenase (cytochrome c)
MKTLILLLLFAQVALGQVSYERLLRAEAEPGNWLTYSGNYRGHRFSALKQIHSANVARLRPVWVYQSRDPGKFSTSPIVVDGVLYITERPNVVTALDGKTGRPIWSYQRALPPDLRACCGATNRGLAILGATLFFGTLDAHLVALDMRTGKARWDAVVADYKIGSAITVAPLVVKDKVIVGVAGGEYGIRGLLDAYDAKTGQRVWRFWTTPGPGEPGRETWAGESWKTGGAPTWITGSYDPELNLVYWGTGNPGPDFDDDERAGDNLYTNSLLALDADTGKLKRYFQFTPHDVHDWDAAHVPALLDGVVGGRQRKLAVEANRNAFYYVLDRETGEFLSGTPFAKQTWAQGLDARGKPIPQPNTAPTPEGRVIYPGLNGGTNWFSPSYNPLNRLFYVATREEGSTFYRAKGGYIAGELFFGGGIRGITGVEPSGSIKALEVETGKLRWEFKLHSPPWAGLLSTAGGLVFGGSSEGMFFALDAGSGKPLWHFPTGGPIYANPVSFLVDGKQHVTIAAGQALFAFALD